LLGNNSGNTNSYVPVAVAQGEIPVGVRLTSLTNGYYHTCATASNSKVYCWGDNSAGQLGIGGAAGGIYSYPRAVALPTGVSAASISSAYQHTCAVGSDSKVYCWGRNAEGQLGNNSTTQSTSPVKVVTNTSGAELKATAISSAYYHSCAVGVGADRDLPYCWGQNSAYQLGTGGTTPSLIAAKASRGGAGIPYVVTLMPYISTYYQHTCVIGSNSLVYCWGANGYRQIGDGTSTTATFPKAASTVSNAPGDSITGLSVGDYHTCINTSAAKIFCWGYNVYGGLGNGTSTSPSDVAQVAGGTSSTNLGAGVYTKLSTKFGSPCAIGPESRPYCWGSNTSGQLGNGTITNATYPWGVSNGQIPVGATIRDIEQGWTHTCAIASDDKVYCWGNNNNGQLGNGTTSAYVATPVAVSQGEIPSGVKIRSLAVNGLHTCALATNFKAYCWGRNDYGQLGNGVTNAQYTSPVAVLQGAIPVGVTLSSLTTGQSHSCAIGSNDKAYCWGRNDVGSLGNGTLTSSNIPTAVTQGAIPAGVAIRSLTANSLHTCTVGSDGKAYCWGYNSSGQLGNGTITQASSPVAVSQGAIPAGVTIRSVTAGYGHACAYASNNNLYCWGESYANGTTTDSSVPVFATPVNTLPAGVTIVSVISGSVYNCILGSDAKFYCWGTNNSGQLGNGATTTSTSLTMTPVTQALRWPSSITVDSLIARY
jgi:alpha-tubulin suppressor-like RCC1 family protein